MVLNNTIVQLEVAIVKKIINCNSVTHPMHLLHTQQAGINHSLLLPVFHMSVTQAYVTLQHQLHFTSQYTSPSLSLPSSSSIANIEPASMVWR